MRRFVLPLLFSVTPALSAAEQALTLDPSLYADALRAVQANKAKESASEARTQAPHAAASSHETAEWSLAMAEVGTPQCDVRLILLLQRLNPGADVDALADALNLHRLFLAGNARACRQLATALRCGSLPGGLIFIRSDELAQAIENRAAHVHLCPPLPTEQSEQTETQPASAAEPPDTSS